ncbi:MAG: beta-lactamase family protein [Sphingobacteriaceae bacterium]|nr:beta-lactamase family protein [Sphingobacteriaceae bacterium]MBK7817607.1 beta-lactamase family protein [Sphingobacteriaceae bacterium]
MKKVSFIIIFILTVISCGSDALSNEKKIDKPKLKTGQEDKDARVKTRLDSMFTVWNRLNSFNGSVLIGRDGKILLQKSYGLADREHKIYLNDSTMFQLASVSKVITATAILMLHERKLIDIEQPFETYFPGFNYNGITVKQLLCHRSGLPNYIYFLNSEIGTSGGKFTNQQVYDQMCFKAPAPYLKPNKRFNYCNTNYALLALLIEKVTGTPYEDYLKKELFEPLGMKNTCTINEIDSNRIAKAYNLKWRTEPGDASDYVLGDKSIFSTPYDLFLFSEAMYQNKILSLETQALAYAPYSKEQRDNNYGFGWRMRDHKDSVKKEVFHNGWWHGYRTAFHRRLRDKTTIIVLSNQLNKNAYHTYLIYEILDNKTGQDTLQLVDGE